MIVDWTYGDIYQEKTFGVGESYWNYTGLPTEVIELFQKVWFKSKIRQNINMRSKISENLNFTSNINQNIYFQSKIEAEE